MRQVDRLFQIIQLLRGRRLRTAAFLADQLEVSVRTIYRDIHGLMASGVPIQGEAGMGYIIQKPIEIAPLKLTALEVKALEFSVALASATADKYIAQAAQEAMVKINDASTSITQDDHRPLAHIQFETDPLAATLLPDLRSAIHEHNKIFISYQNQHNRQSKRLLCPLALEYWGRLWTMVGWCELRNDFRVFRLDRIKECELTDEKFRLEKGKSYQDFLRGIENKCD